MRVNEIIKNLNIKLFNYEAEIKRLTNIINQKNAELDGWNEFNSKRLREQKLKILELEKLLETRTNQLSLLIK